MQKIPTNFRPVSIYGFVVPNAGPTFTVMGMMAASKMSISGGMGLGAMGVGIMSTTPSVTLMEPADLATAAVKTPTFKWQIPSSWSVVTTNYILEISPGNQTFGQVDDQTINLNASQVANNATVIAYTLKDTEAIGTGVQYWKVTAKNISNNQNTTSNAVFSFTYNLSLSLENVINYPNPFVNQTSIRYRLSKDADVSILIFDMSGSLVRKLEFFAGSSGGKQTSFMSEYNDVVFDGKNDRGHDIVNGVYFYEVVASNGTETQRIRGKMVKWK
jgi:hypothetical protein